MTDHHQPAIVILQKATQPADRVRVQVVGRLIEQQCHARARAAFGRTEEDPRELDTAALPAGKRPQRLNQNPLGQPETRADPGGFTLGDISAQRGETLLQLPVAAHRFIALVVVGQLGHQCLLLFHLADDGVQAARRQHPVTSQQIQISLFGILWQITNFANPGHRAGVWFTLAGQNPHRGGLAGPVTAHQTDAVTGLNT
ncbi:Uncharacterised protein [Mycobacteroides abscessus subsp. abscessus]|nr:Uncharacterised protein [Mycobacteroides abscessus subsp. abscessus]